MNILLLDDSISFLVNKTAQKFKLELNRKLKQHGLEISSDQWTVLMHLSESDGPTQTDLAGKLYKDRSNLTRILDLLEKAELVERKRSTSDRREFNVFITQKGKDMIPLLKKTGEEVFSKALIGANENEIVIVKTFLNKLFNNLEK